jgi:electron transport complex protein RnfG
MTSEAKPARAPNALAQAWLMIVLTFGSGAVLAWADASFRPRIEANKLAETLSRIPALVPGADSGRAEAVGAIRAFRALKGEAPAGWVVAAAGQGFADRIELLIGLDAQAETLTGLYVLDQKETPGLGNKIEDDAWRAQFNGKRASMPLRGVKGAARAEANEIQVVTGATISSDAVCEIANRAVKDFRAALAARGGN